MADVLEDICDSSPAKRVKLEAGEYPLASRNEFTLPNDLDSPLIYGSARFLRSVIDQGPSETLPLGELSDTNLGLAFADPGAKASEGFTNGTFGAMNGGVSSSSDMKEYFNSGDSGFNELTSPASSASLPDPGIGLENNLTDDACNIGEPDSSVLPNDFELPVDDDGDDRDEVASTISHLSGLSDLSDISGQDWKPIAGPMGWVQRQMQMGTNPKDLLQQLLPSGINIPTHLDDTMLWRIIVNMLCEPPRRTRLHHVNTIENVIDLITSSEKIIVLTGAGVSVSCGIPDFRSRDGIYSRLAKDFPDLPDPQSMFDIHYFRKDPRPFFKFAKEIYPGQFHPSLSHRFIKLLEAKNKLLRNYSQNIDTLEQIAGIQNVIQCHGSFATASCTKCGYKVNSTFIEDDVFQQRIPFCPHCPKDTEDLAIMKPDIVFFGEGLPEEFHSTMAKDKNQCDLLIVIGSSLKVQPVALIPSSLPASVPQILINREPLRHMTFDVELLGDCDNIINEMCHRLGNGWNDLCCSGRLTELTELPPLPKQQPSQRSSDISSGVSSESEVSSCIPTGNKDISCDSTTEQGETSTDDSKAPADGKTVPSEANTSDPDSTNVGEEEDVDPKSEDDLVALRACWRPKLKESLADRLPDEAYLFVSPNRYIFTGAEVFYDPELETVPNDKSDADSDSDSYETSSTSDGDSPSPVNEINELGNESEVLDDRAMCGEDSGVSDVRDTDGDNSSRSDETVSTSVHLPTESTIGS